MSSLLHRTVKTISTTTGRSNRNLLFSIAKQAGINCNYSKSSTIAQPVLETSVPSTALDNQQHAKVCTYLFLIIYFLFMKQSHYCIDERAVDNNTANNIEDHSLRIHSTADRYIWTLSYVFKDFSYRTLQFTL